ncbi:MAG: hypothetical protein ACOYNU_12805 [Bacteroidales bacterium]
MRSLTPRRSNMVSRNIRLILHIDALIREGNSKQQAFSNAGTSLHLSESSAYRIYNDRYRYNVPNQQ